MTKIWDTGADEGAPPGVPFTHGVLGARNNRVISWCNANTTYGRAYLREDGAGNKLFCYAHGDDNGWTEEILVRSNSNTGRLGLQATVDTFSMCVDQTGGANDHVHFTFDDIVGSGIYHAELVLPASPQFNGNWTTWAAVRYQLVTAAAGTNPDIDTDSAGNPLVVYNMPMGGGQYQVYINHGIAGGHAMGVAITISGNIGNVLYPSVICVHEDTRDVYVFVNNGSLIEQEYCDKAGLPLTPASWVGGPWTTVLNFNGFGEGDASAPSVYYWYEPGAPLAQIMVATNDQDQGTTRSNWYDEGNVNGWGGGWQNAGGTIAASIGNQTQVTRVDANDFALSYVPWSGGQPLYAFTDYGGASYDFTAGPRRYFTNVPAPYISSEERGREHVDFSYATIHMQVGVDFDFMFDLVRDNIKPMSANLSPAGGQRRDEANIITLSWTFTDPGQIQTQWSIEVDEFGEGFAGPIWTSGVMTGADVTDTIPGLTLAFNTHYEWRVKVWDNEKGDEYDPYSESDWGV